MWFVGPVVAAMIGVFTPDPEPPAPPVRHSPAVNICHPVKADPQGRAYVDRTIDLCHREHDQ